MAQKLMQLLPETESCENILELGCGSGNLSDLLLRRFPQSQIILTDISSEMLSQCQQHVAIQDFHGEISWETADAQSPLPFRNCQLICSNALLQWIENPEAHFHYVKESLRPGGKYLFSGLSHKNFPELNQILRMEPFSFDTFTGHSESDIVGFLRKTGFTNIVFAEERKPAYYPSFNAFLRLLKEGGASGRPGFFMTRGKLKFLGEKYTRLFKAGDGIIVTWRPWFCLADNPV
jgi:malonyl-CoA O-methyltransferase